MHRDLYSICRMFCFCAGCARLIKHSEHATVWTTKSTLGLSLGLSLDLSLELFLGLSLELSLELSPELSPKALSSGPLLRDLQEPSRTYSGPS